jgi:hypothetical protein
MRPTELAVRHHKIDKRRDYFVLRPPAGNGWPIDRNTGQQSIGGPWWLDARPDTVAATNRREFAIGA